MVMGDSGIFSKASEVKEETNKAQAKEKLNLKITNAQIENYAENQTMLNLQELANILDEDNEIEYVHIEKGIYGTIGKVDIGNAKSIYTKLAEYPYEFEINDSLQLASIDGIQVGNLTNVQESNKINNVDFTAKPLATSITVNITTDGGNSVIGYHLFCTKSSDSTIKKAKVNENSNIVIDGLEKSTKYKIYVVAYDIDNNMKISQVKEIETNSVTYLYDKGTEYKQVTLGPEQTFSKENTYISGSGADSSGVAQAWVLCMIKDLDVTNIENIYVHFYDVNLSNENMTLLLTLCKEYHWRLYGTDCYAIDKIANQAVENGEFTLKINVKDLTGIYNLSFGGDSSKDYRGYNDGDNEYTGSISYKIDEIYYD